MEVLQEKKPEPIAEAWVASSLRDGGVPYELLFQIYDELFRSRVRFKAILTCFNVTD